MAEKNVFNMGRWSAEYDEDGKCTKVEYSEGYLKLIGVDSVDETDSENLWRNAVHPDDLKKIDAVYEDLYAKHPEGMDYDLECRIKVGTEYHLFHDFGHCTRREDGSVIRVEGVLFDIQGIIDVEKAHKELAQNNARILALSDNFVSLYDVDLETGSYVVYVKNHLLSDERIEVMVNNDDFVGDTLRNAETVVVPEDREALIIVLSPDFIRSELEKNSHFDFYYRLMPIEKPVWAKLRMAYKDPDKKRVIIGVFNAENDIEVKQLEEQKAQLQETLSFTNFFLETYISAFYIDLVTKEYKVFKEPLFTHGNSFMASSDYIEAITAFAKQSVRPEDIDELLELIQPENIRAHIKNDRKGQITYTFRDSYTEAERYVRMHIVRGADEDHATLGFKDVTSDVLEQQKHLLGAVPISSDILAKEGIGMWAFELDEGQPPRMYGDEAMIRLVGLDRQVPPEEMYHAWYDRIDESSYGLVNDAVAKMISGELAEVQYPWHHPSGETWMVRCGGIRNPEYTRGIRVEGTHQNVTEVLHFDEDERKLRFRMSMIYSLSDEYAAVMVVEPESGEYDWYESKAEEIEDLTSMTVHGKDFYKDIGNDIASIIHEDDREQFRAVYCKDNIRRIAYTGETQETENRWKVGPDGSYLWKYNKLVRMTDESGNVFVAVGVIDTTEERTREAEYEAQKKLLEEQQALNENAVRLFALEDNFEAMYDVNFETGDYDVFVKGQTFSEEISTKFVDRREFFEDSHKNIEAVAYPDDVADFKKTISRENIKKALAIDNHFDYYYRLMVNGMPEWFRMRVVYKDDDRKNIIIGIFNAEKEREAQQLEEQLALSDGLAREYHTVWLVEGQGEHRLHLFRSTGKKTVQRAVQRGLDEPTYDGTMVKYVLDSVHEDDRERVLEASKFESVVRETPDTGTYVITYKRYCDDEGNVDYHQMCFAKAAASDGTINYILAFRDADNLIREQLNQQKQLAEALSMAESANRAKTTFLNNMSHDIRTPMNAIIGYTGLAASHIDNRDQVRDYLAKIAQSSDHLLSLINDVLDMSRIESGKMNLDEKPENLSDIIHTIRDIIQADIHSKQQDLFVDAVDVNDEDIICDKLRLNQVLLNVLSNAIKYTAAGGTVTMRVREKTVKQSGYGSYEFIIKDNGMGMTGEFLEHIFDPFERVKSSTVSGIQGTGLGMAITKNIIDMMGGTIDIASEPGKGTEVTMCFDFRLQSAHKIPEEIPELKGVRALVADDDSNTCLSICNMVKDVGMRFEWCTSGREAVIRAEAAYHGGDSFKVYIIDWIMPDMNGIETTRRIRKAIGNDAPIIILTAYDWSDIEDEAREAGVTAFVSKPMFPSDLHRVLFKCLGMEEAAPEIRTEEFDFTGKKILLVEDNEMNREIATEILEEAGFIVDTADDGDVAVEKMRAAKTGDYDLVLMDVQMPRMDGYKATRLIREMNSDISGIPILAMTANAFEEDRKAALESGMNEHIAKPIDILKLKETLAKFL